MADTHLEDLLDAGLEESFPASDPVSVFVDVPQKPLPGERVHGAPGTNGIPWAKWAAALPVVVSVLGKAASMVYQRRAAQRERERRGRLLLAGAAAGALVVGLVIAGVRTRATDA